MIDATTVLAGLPKGLRDELLQSYREIAANYVERRWEPSELNGGKFCEVVYTILNGCIKGTYPTKASKPVNMVDACRALEKEAASPKRVGDRSLRILIPRILSAMYEIRNNRGVGHVGGDVNSNFLDATAVYGMASWTLAELVRVFHGIPTKEAQEVVDVLIERKHPLIWEVGSVRRVLSPSMATKDQVLVLLHGKHSRVSASDLANSVDYSDLSMFRVRVLEPLHKDRFIEFDREQNRAHISPLGVKEVETRILKTRSI